MTVEERLEEKVKQRTEHLSDKVLKGNHKHAREIAVSIQDMLEVLENED